MYLELFVGLDFEIILLSILLMFLVTMDPECVLSVLWTYCCVHGMASAVNSSRCL